jgi:hypothetical protein
MPDNLSFAKGMANTPFGTAASAWEKTADGMAYAFHIPHNMTGVFTVPVIAGGYEMIMKSQ